MGGDFFLKAFIKMMIMTRARAPRMAKTYTGLIFAKGPGVVPTGRTVATGWNVGYGVVFAIATTTGVALATGLTVGFTVERGLGVRVAAVQPQVDELGQSGFLQ